jgi:hypothetical protein
VNVVCLYPHTPWGPGGVQVHATQSARTAMDRLWAEVVAPHCPPRSLADPAAFRRARVYAPAVATLLATHREALQCVFASYCSSDPRQVAGSRPARLHVGQLQTLLTHAALLTEGALTK